MDPRLHPFLGAPTRNDADTELARLMELATPSILRVGRHRALSPRELASHAGRRLAATDILRVSDHLAGCAACCETFNWARMPTGEFPAGPESEVPTFAELDGAMNGTLTPVEREGLAASPTARDALADLTAFRDELASLPVKFYGPVQPPGKVAPLLRQWRGTPAWAAGLAAVFVVLVVWWGTFTHTSRNGAALLPDDRGRPVSLAGPPTGLRVSIEDALCSGQLPPAPAHRLTRGHAQSAIARKLDSAATN